ncbi:hypothetical protein BU23DRAFT_654700 [Bimuria novae-zelandiae CBS 107.79]|uniref:Myb-like domain-containing protein n=1 Tax=Bimuria novae-zelandiae CBS 107.79 TaxID=1447943 RepID=A0A6A5VYH9_9PLEO|nr:hypothetical protein BU23DRAFT_654700 [Bimuria novae-zelandiae CBS 107.79]
MTTFPSTFPVQKPLQFVPYGGPPKQTPRRLPTKGKTLPGDDDTRGDREELAHATHRVEVGDLTYSANTEADCEISGIGIESNDVSSDDPTEEQEGVSMPTFQGDTGDRTPRQPATSEDGSQDIAGVVNDNHLDSSSDSDSGDPYEEDASLLTGDRLEIASTSTPEYCNRDVDVIDAINFGTVGKAKTQASELPQWQLPSTPPSSPSMTNIEPSTEGAFRCVDTEATMYRRPTESKSGSKARISTIESTSSESSSGSSTDDEDDYNGKYATSQTRKRKRFPSSNSASRKRQTITITEEGGLQPALRRKTCFTAASSEESYNRGRPFRKRLKAMGSNESSIHSSAPATPHANRQARFSVKGVLPEEVQWHLSGITFHSLSADVSLLTAIFRTRGVPGILTTSHAVNLLKRAMGDFTKLDNIAICPFTSNTWFLTSLAYLRTGGDAGCGTGRPLPAPSSLPMNRAYTASLRDHGRPRDDVDHDDDDDNDYKSSGEDYDKDGDSDEEDPNDTGEKPSSSRTHTRWSEDDDKRLRSFKEDGRRWGWIYKQFPGRSPGAVQVRWHQKLRSKP